MTEEPRREEEEAETNNAIKTDAKSGTDIQESRTPPESLVSGPNPKEISSSLIPLEVLLREPSRLLMKLDQEPLHHDQ
jgi:hypothetical protein